MNKKLVSMTTEMLFNKISLSIAKRVQSFTGLLSFINKFSYLLLEILEKLHIICIELQEKIDSIEKK